MKTRTNPSHALSMLQKSYESSANGLYTVVLGDDGSFYSGSGGYSFTVNGLSSGLKLYRDPIVSGTNIQVSGIGGTNSGTFRAPHHHQRRHRQDRAIWTPILTNSFDTFGTFTASNLFLSTDNKRYFLILEP